MGSTCAPLLAAKVSFPGHPIAESYPGPIGPISPISPIPPQRRKHYFDGGQVEIAAELVRELDSDGKQLRMIKLTDYAAVNQLQCPLYAA